MDGDTLVNHGALARSLEVLNDHPRLHAVTIANRVRTENGGLVRAWYELRFAQRHLIMASLALSERLLVLTGRFSMFRAEVALTPAFIARLEQDSIDTWRYGRIPLLTGDDKSTWFALVERGLRMTYVPDVDVVCAEELPDPSFFVSAVKLNRRWLGNSLRNNARSLALGPTRLGWFPWLALVDQRLSKWTALVGLTAALILSVTSSWWALPAYFVWVMLVRSIQSVIIGALNGQARIWYPPLLYFNQLLTAVVKLTVAFQLDRQSWTRQGVTAGGKARHLVAHPAWIRVNMALALAAFVALVGLYAGAWSAAGGLAGLGGIVSNSSIP
jgi:glycosyltransferase Alg8